MTTFLGVKYPQVAPTLEHIFDTAFRVSPGLVGTAVGFYLKERKGSVVLLETCDYQTRLLRESQVP